MQKKRWIIQPADDRCAQLAKSLKVSPLLAQVLINRGITDASAGCAYLRPKLTGLISAEQMPGAKAAARRLKQHIKNKNKIAVYGDYDVDGITGVAILWRLLTLLGAEVDYYIPHRIDEGYGLNEEAVRSLAESGTKLLITVDCGITAFGSAELAGRLGLELIITDHHRIGPELPESAGIVHPALEESYANQDSSGSMVAFKLGWALANEFNGGGKLEPGLRQFMLNATSLAAMGTIADIVDIRGENRILTSYGLKLLPDCRLCGVQALIESAGLAGQEMNSNTIGFRLAPLLNAAGRLGHARLAVELLTSDDGQRSMQIAEYLKEQNSSRQQYERKIFKQACEMIVTQRLDQPDRKSIVLAGDHWHGGVIGIVASRVVDRYHRPTIMISTPPLTEGRGIAAGSARSIEGFDILSAITACSKHLISFGGHKMAAGITIETGRIARFAADFEEYANQNISEEDITGKLDIDATAALGQFSKEAVAELGMLAPYGAGNPEPLFATKGVRLASAPRRVGASADHLQVAITDGTNSVRCIGFAMGALEKKLLDREFFNVAYQPQINTYNGTGSVELVLSDIQFE
jgi:single-stranded-DNA-specific exonuclease